MRARSLCPDKNCGGYQQRPDGVADPPRTPGLDQFWFLDQPSRVKTGNSDCGADHRRERRREHDESEHLAQPIERKPESWYAIERVRSNNRFECVASSDARRGKVRSTGEQVCD